MKALAYEKAHALDAFALDLIEVDEPELGDRDLVVEIRAIGVNPGEAFIRSIRSAAPGGRVILGWEFAGVVTGTGPAATGFAVGDRVMGTGDITRDGCWAQRLAVDHRVVATIPDQLSFADAASLPIGSLTAWEAMFGDQPAPPPGVDTVLIVGGAGGVGSMATQLLKARTSAFVIGTASRPQSRQWCQAMGADLVIDHTADVTQQLSQAGIEQVDMVLSTAGTADNLAWIGACCAPSVTCRPSTWAARWTSARSCRSRSPCTPRWCSARSSPVRTPTDRTAYSRPSATTSRPASCARSSRPGFRASPCRA